MFGLSEQEIRDRLQDELIRAIRSEGEAPTIHALAHSMARVLDEDHLRMAEQLERAGVRMNGTERVPRPTGGAPRAPAG